MRLASSLGQPSELHCGTQRLSRLQYPVQASVWSLTLSLTAQSLDLGGRGLRVKQGSLGQKTACRAVPRRTGATSQSPASSRQASAPFSSESLFSKQKGLPDVLALQDIDLGFSRAGQPHLTGSRWPAGENGRLGLPPGLANHKTLRQTESPVEGSESGARCPASPLDSSQQEGSLPCVRLLYSTGWRNPVIHFSAQGLAWKTACLEQVHSSGGHLCETVIDLLGPEQLGASSADAAAATLEFVITDGQDNWDKPAAGGNYSLTGHGTFMLRNGAISAIAGSRYLVASDLDDTLIGDDAGTHAFREFWENQAVLQGSRLVFNTGRALDSFLLLQDSKADCLPTPDLLIAAVGTKIYERRDEQGWVENAEFAAQLDEGWDLNVVREACYQAVMTVGRESMHFRPPEEQNNHKVTCGVLAPLASDVQESIQSALHEQQVQAKLMFSGKGDWRYLDIVSKNAGKAEALNFAMRRLGFSPANTVACGDSGNDKDMLAAANLAVVVGNAQPDLKQWLASLPHDDLHMQGRLRLTQSRADYALGILEGLAEFGLIATKGS